MTRRSFFGFVGAMAGAMMVWRKKNSAKTISVSANGVHQFDMDADQADTINGEWVRVNDMWFRDGDHYRSVDGGPWEYIVHSVGPCDCGEPHS